jgi:hypothetical protein
MTSTGYRRARSLAALAMALAACSFNPSFPTNIKCTSDEDCRSFAGATCGPIDPSRRVRVCCMGHACDAAAGDDGGSSEADAADTARSDVDADLSDAPITPLDTGGSGGSAVGGSGGSAVGGGGGSAVGGSGGSAVGGSAVGGGGGSAVGGSGGSASPPGMVLITFPGSGDFWIDAYEASLVPGVGKIGSGSLDADGDGKIADRKTALAHARSHGFQFDEDPNHAGQLDPGEAAVLLTTLVAQSKPYAQVALDMTFWQAASACANAGKRLCTAAEWRWACGGAGANNAFPYGNQYDGGNDMGDCWTNMLGPLALTGTASRCVTPQGLYDMSGNADEMTDVVGGLVQGRGGWAYGNVKDSSCANASTIDLAYTNSTWGFRCCRDP